MYYGDSTLHFSQSMRHKEASSNIATIERNVIVSMYICVCLYVCVCASVLVEGNVVIGAFKRERYGCGSSSPSMDSDVRMRAISTFQLNLQHKDFSHTPFTSVDYCYSSKCRAIYLHTSQVCVLCAHV